MDARSAKGPKEDKCGCVIMVVGDYIDTTYCEKHKSALVRYYEQYTCGSR